METVKPDRGQGEDLELASTVDVVHDDGPLSRLSITEWMDVIPSAVAIADHTGRLVYLNDAWMSLRGDRSPALRGDAEAQPDNSRVFDADGNELERSELALFRALHGETVVDSEIILESEPGRQVWLRTNARPICSREGRVIGAIAASHDVTDFRLLQREHALQRDMAERRAQELETMIRSIADPVIITDADGKTMLTNPAYTHMLGPEQEATGIADRFDRLKLRAWDGSDLEMDQGPIARAIGGDEFTNAEYLIRNRRGEDVYTRVSGAPLHDAVGDVVGAVAVLRDVSAIYEQERERDRFVSVIAHELRTPITIIRGFTQLLRQSELASESEATARRLEIIDRRTEQLAALISELLDLSQLEVGTFAVTKQPSDYIHLVESMVNDIRVLHPDRELQISLPESGMVNADPQRISQVLTNLIDNAFVHGPPGLPVTITVVAGPSDIRTYVSDAGPSPPEEQKERIFERFYQFQMEDAGYKRGMGLGLYISKQIVEAHGGRIWLGDSPTTTFAFSLPLLDAEPTVKEPVDE